MAHFTIPEGIIPPLLTPLTTDQKVDVVALKKLIKKQVDAGIPALFVCGTAGLGSVLTIADYETVIATAKETVPQGYPILCGVLESSTMRSLERIRLLESLKIECFVTITPYYLKATEKDDLLRHFGSLRDSTNMEMVLYNMPGCTGVVIDPDLIFDMVKRGWSTTVKDSSADNEYFERLCRDGAEFNLKVYQGLDPYFGWLNEIGAAGCVPLPANSHPELFLSAWEARADKEQISKIQPEVTKVWNELIVGTDYLRRSLSLLEKEGIGSGSLMLPFVQY